MATGSLFGIESPDRAALRGYGLWGQAAAVEDADKASTLGYRLEVVSLADAIATPFEELDREAAELVGIEFGTNVVWRPMSARPGGQYTGGAAMPDASRPVVAGIRAIATWRPTTVGSGATDSIGGAARGSLSDFDLAIDVAASQFETAAGSGIFELPKRGDVFELPDEWQDNKLVRVETETDDGSSRVVLYCSVMSARDIV